MGNWWSIMFRSVFLTLDLTKTKVLLNLVSSKICDSVYCVFDFEILAVNSNTQTKQINTHW